MSARLRFASTSFMPEPLRKAVEAQELLKKQLSPAMRDVLPWYDPAPEPLQGPARKKRAGDPEHQEQASLIRTLHQLAGVDPRYQLAVERTFAIPNGGGRSKREAGRLKAEGVLPGVSDLFCALPVGNFHGLFMEMKSLTGQPSREQRHWLSESVKLDYCGCVARGAKEALTLWKAYVEGSF